METKLSENDEAGYENPVISLPLVIRLKHKFKMTRNFDAFSESKLSLQIPVLLQF